MCSVLKYREDYDRKDKYYYCRVVENSVKVEIGMKVKLIFSLNFREGGNTIKDIVVGFLLRSEEVIE